MLLRWFLLVIFGGWGLAQSVPIGYGLEEGTQILVFVSPNCAACESLATLKDFPVTFVGRAEQMPYSPYRQDKGDLLARALRIQSAPTLVVLKDGWEVKRLTGKINPSAKTLGLLFDAAEAGLLSPAYTLAVSLGQVAPAPYQDFSGLLVFGYERCRWCELEKESWARLCQRSVNLRIIYSEGRWPEVCKGELSTELFGRFGVPGTPTHVYLRQGRVVWIDVGYRSDLEEVVQALEAMGGR